METTIVLVLLEPEIFNQNWKLMYKRGFWYPVYDMVLQVYGQNYNSDEIIEHKDVQVCDKWK